MKKIGILFLLVVYAISVRGADAQRTAAGRGNPGVQVTIRPIFAGGMLEVHYSVINKTDVPVLVFDRMRNLRTGEPDPNWAFLEIAGGRAVLKRAMEDPHAPLMKENIPAPYAREVPKGGAVFGSFQVAVPLRQSDANGQLDRKAPAVTEIDQLEMWVGWCPKSELRSASLAPRKFGADLVWIPSYLDILEVQKIAKSASVAMPLRILENKK